MQASTTSNKKEVIFIFSVFILTVSKPLACSNRIMAMSVSCHQEVRLNDSVQDNENQSFVTFCAGREGQEKAVLLPGKSHGRRSLVGCSPRGREESDTTERLRFHFSLSCIGEGNGKPLQCSCLENLRDGRAWWAAVYGVAQSRTRLKRLSSSSSKEGQKGKLPLYTIRL